MTGEQALLRQFVHSLMQRHPRPWRVEIDWTIEVYDKNDQLVLKLQSYEQQKALFDLVKVIDEDSVRARAAIKEQFGVDLDED